MNTPTLTHVVDARYTSLPNADGLSFGAACSYQPYPAREQIEGHALPFADADYAAEVEYRFGDRWEVEHEGHLLYSDPFNWSAEWPLLDPIELTGADASSVAAYIA